MQVAGTMRNSICCVDFPGNQRQVPVFSLSRDTALVAVMMNSDPFLVLPVRGSAVALGGALSPYKECGSFKNFLPLLTPTEGNSEFILSEFTVWGECALLWVALNSGCLYYTDGNYRAGIGIG